MGLASGAGMLCWLAGRMEAKRLPEAPHGQDGCGSQPVWLIMENYFSGHRREGKC
jgi:hypothetical protein